MDTENTDENQPSTSKAKPPNCKGKKGNNTLNTETDLSLDKINLNETVQNETPEKRSLINEHGEYKNKKPLFVEDSGPKMYPVKGNLVTKPILPKNLPEQFSSLPIYGQPENKKDLPQFFKNKIREFVGFDLDDEEFEKLSKYCSPDHLRTGDEIQMATNLPTYGPFPSVSKKKEKQVIDKAAEKSNEIKLNIYKKFKLRVEKDKGNHYHKNFKYRGIRMMPLPTDVCSTPTESTETPLEAGKELLFRVRIYRPYSHKNNKSGRHALFETDVVLPGRMTLQTLRDQFVCANDASVRLDVADDPDNPPTATPKTLFPSGFLFVNNVFYVDHRAGCVDHSAVVRAWASKRGLGEFPARDMAAAPLHDIVLKLGHPEVYVHQGNCEHLFMFSEIRLVGPRDALLPSQYPLHTECAHHQAVYCTTCAEFSAKWIVVGCQRVPFDPAFFCNTCFKMYLYKDGKKIGDFKAYAFKGNELNMLKP